MKLFNPPAVVSLPRRRFVQGLSAGCALASLGVAPLSLATGQKSPLEPTTLKGSTFNLNIGYQAVNFTGITRQATSVNGSVPGPTLRWKEGELITLRVKNQLVQDSSIHWHGIILPSGMDGVPGLSFAGIKPGKTFEYQFKLNQSGTYWYHSHSDFQEQTGVYGAIVIDPVVPVPFAYDRDYVVQLSDWSDEDPNRIYAKLKKLSHYYNFQERTLSDLLQDINSKGVTNTWRDRFMWNSMRMSDRDLSDVTGYTYTFLMNGQTPAEGWKGLFKKGEKVLLRFINSSAMTLFDIRIEGLKMTVVASDGQYIEPVTVDEFRIGVAETFDVIVEPDADSAYSVFAQSIDRTGFARGTLTPNMTLSMSPPPLDPVPRLGYSEMGMDMSAMKGMDHSEKGMDMSAMKGMDHSEKGMDMSAMKGMDQGNMEHEMPGMDHSSMGHDMPAMERSALAKAGQGSRAPVEHIATELGPHVDMRAAAPKTNLDDPGIGLRNNGRRVLTYADLFNLHHSLDLREPEREIALHLTGNMSRYMWSINGVKFADAEPLQLNYGERVRLILVNDTMMNHPIHLHGMWSELETGDGNKLPRKHTILVQPGSQVSYLVTADALGRWAYHCHLLYHMPGMFREVRVSKGRTV